MAIRLTAWLEETFATQLLLGNNWLQSKNEQKQKRITSDPGRAWRGLYHDNGSCLDITNDIHPERNSNLQIIQLAPLVLTDGQTQVRPHFAPECLSLFPPQIALHAVIAVRKYTIRYTSYGPPRDALRFILHAVDWLGDAPRGLQGQQLNELRSEEIQDVLQRLHHTRACEDRRCLDSTQQGADEIPPDMYGTDEGESQPHTQFAFGTQMVHPVRPRPTHDEPSVLGVKRLEPVLAGNTQREDIRPKAANSRTQLLSLLSNANLPVTENATKTIAGNLARAAPSKLHRTAEPSNTGLQTQLPAVAHRQPTQPQERLGFVGPASPKPAQGTKRARAVDVEFPRVEHSTAESSNNAIEAEEPHGDRLKRLASECAWMNDFDFSRESLRVPYDQRLILDREESWHKPPIGKRFPAGNMPIQTLTMLQRLADEEAALEGRPDSDDEMDEDPSPEDPSPDPSPESVLQQAQDDQTLTQVSWSQSPSPEPPQMPSRPNQGLPPDSSFEMPEASANHTARRTLIIPSSPHLAVIDSSKEKAPNAPPSSPPVEIHSDEALKPTLYEDDMEMEDFLPQGLGEDTVEGASEVQNGPPPSLSPPPKPTVQVKETPYVKSKGTRLLTSVTSPRAPMHSSSITAKSLSSTSIVYGTYEENTESSSVAQERRPKATEAVVTIGEDDIDQLHCEPASSSRARESRESAVAMTTINTKTTTAHAQTAQLQQVRPQEQITKSPLVEKDAARSSPLSSPVTALPKTTTSTMNVPASPNPADAFVNHGPLKRAVASKSPSLPPGAAKRKLENSPSKRSSRQPKRRELKIVSFGDASPPSLDAASALRQHREDSLRKFREERKSSTSFESHPDSAVTAGERTDSNAMEIDSPDAQRSDESSTAMSPRHLSLYEAPSLPEQVQTVAMAQPTSGTPQAAKAAQAQIDPEPPATTRQVLPSEPRQTSVSNTKSSNIFELFKATYPEYTGDVKHFQGQCIQMLKLDQEDKMVPKWQWDDYIIRNRTDFKDYALDCVDRGEDAVPYHRFYKDTIRDTLFRKGVIEGRATLLSALEQLGVQPPVSESVPPPVSGHPERQRHVSSKKSRSRASLPSAFNQPKASKKHQVFGTDHNRPRHSLPANAQMPRPTPPKPVHSTKFRTPAPPASKQAPKEARSTKKPNLLSRLSLDGAASPRASVNGDAAQTASDPYRDFFFAYQRTTSLTGSTEVDSRLPWPKSLAVRPSIADVPKGKVDVLKWSDEL